MLGAYSILLVILLLVEGFFAADFDADERAAVLAQTAKGSHIGVSRQPWMDINWPLEEIPATEKQYQRHDQATSGSFAPLRIRFETSALESKRGLSADIDAQIDAILNGALPKAAYQWSRHLSVQSYEDPVFITNGICSNAYGNLTQNTLIDDADLVLVVGGEDVVFQDAPQYVCAGGTTLAVAIPCSLDPTTKRPIVGMMNFCLDRTSPFQAFDAFLQGQYSTQVELRQSHKSVDLTDVTLHEMGHVLGFHPSLYYYFRDEYGNLRNTNTSSQIYECPNGSYGSGIFPSGVLELIENELGIKSYYLTTPAVKQVVRNQFACQDLPGARLEDPQSSCIGSHWHERHYYNELMGPVYTASSQNALSPITLALMEDSGWYKVDYRNATLMAYGLGAGCGFVEEKCIQNDTVPTWGKGVFCSDALRLNGTNVAQQSLDSITCDPAHISWVICDLLDELDFPEFNYTDIRYFSDTNLVPRFKYADGCPISDRPLGLDCTIDDPYTPFYPYEDVGSSSRCINAYHVDGFTQVNRPACMNVTCDLSSRSVQLANGMLTCEYDYQVLPLGNNQFVECPRLATVCPALLACPAACSGKGICSWNTTLNMPQCDCATANNDGCYPFQASSIPTVAPTVAPTAAPYSSPPLPTTTAPSLGSVGNSSPAFNPTTATPITVPTFPQTNKPTTPLPESSLSPSLRQPDTNPTTLPLPTQVSTSYPLQIAPPTLQPTTSATSTQRSGSATGTDLSSNSKQSFSLFQLLFPVGILGVLIA